MTGEPEYGYPVFNAYESVLKSRGYEVINPVSVGVHEGWTWEQYMKEDLKLLLQADMVALLPGFYNSKGSRTEMYTAGIVGMKTVPIDVLMNSNN